MLTGLQGERTLVKTAAEAYHVLSSLPLLDDESHSRNKQPPVPSRNWIDLHLGQRQRSCLERDLPGVRRLKLAWPDVTRLSSALKKPDVKCYSNYAGKKRLHNKISYHGPEDYSGGRHEWCLFFCSGAYLEWQWFSSLMRSCTLREDPDSGYVGTAPESPRKDLPTELHASCVIH